MAGNGRAAGVCAANKWSLGVARAGAAAICDCGRTIAGRLSISNCADEVPALTAMKRSQTLPAEEWIADTLDAFPMREAPITSQVAQETARAQLPHRDPADRFLVATARGFDLTLVTADEQWLKAR
jgi:PIN domain nuclease of toxin-antitoxin system